jgi:hypothetical protein
MATERDVTRIVQSWLRTDEHESADRVLDNVLALLDATPQRRSWWPAQRNAEMNPFAKLAIAAAAVVAVALIAINLPRAGGGVGGSTPTVAPSSTPSPSASLSLTSPPSPSAPSAVAFPARGELAIATHRADVDGISLSFSVSTPGWFSAGDTTSGGGYIMKGRPGTWPLSGKPDPAFGWILLWSPDGVYTDPCAQKKGPAVGPSAGDLAAALETIAGTEVTRPEKGSVGGHDAQRAVVSVPRDAPCTAEQFHLWYDETIGGRWASLVPTTIKVRIVDVDGKRLFFETELLDPTNARLDEEMQQIVDSIQFE